MVPVKWSGPSLDIMSNQVATETLEVAFQEILGLATFAGAFSGAVSVGVSF